MLALASKSRSHHLRVFTLRDLPLILIFSIGIILSFIAAITVHGLGHERSRLAFEQDAHDSISALQRGLQHHTDEIRAIASLFKASNEVDRVEFRTFIKNILMQNSGTQALEWVPVIRHADRKRHSNAIQADIIGYRISEIAANGKRIPAAPRPVYYPAMFVEPYTENLSALGFDHGSSPPRLAALQQARDSGKLVASTRLALIEEADEQAGVLFVLPVYHKYQPVNTVEQRRTAVQGFIVGMFRINDLVRTSVGYLDMPHISLQIMDLDDTNSVTELLDMTGTDSRQPHGRNGKTGHALGYDEILTVAERRWLVKASSGPEAYAAGSSWNWMIVLSVGILFSLLLTAYLSNNRDRTLKIEQQVGQRTRELHSSKQVLENEIEARKQAGRILAEREAALQQQHELVNAISTAQSQFIRDTDAMALFDRLLLDILRISGSEFGYIGEVLYREDKPYLKVIATSTLSSDPTTREFYASEMRAGMEFTDTDGLFCSPVNNNEICINNSATDFAPGDDVPSGHPRIDTFLALPFYRGDKVIGMFGIANRATGYDPAIVNFLEPIAATCTQLVEALKADRQRELAEAQLRERETRMRTIFENVVDGIITTDEQGVIESFNRAAEKMFGYSADEIIGHNVSILTPARHRSSHDGYIRNYLQGSESEIMGTGREVDGIRKDGSAFPLDIAITEMWIGKRRHFCSIMRDITERKKIDQMKNEFISTVSHELRTPLTSIRGALGLVAGGTTGELPDKAKPLVDIAAKNCDRLIRLINDILDIEKIEANKMEFELRPASLLPLVQQSVESNRVYAADHGATIEVNNDMPDAIIEVDDDRFSQIMTNLVSNAAKYSPEGGVIGVAIQPRDGGVRLSVSDQGPGIPEEFRQRIFEKFSQADGSDTRQLGGTGLGLSITRAIVEKLGGQISFDTVEGQGTTFHVDLPLHDTQARSVPSASDTTCAVAETSSRVLVCEDDADIAQLLSLMLQEQDYAVDIAASAAEVKSRLSKQHYAAMTLDLMLPDQCGLDLFHDIRENEETSKLPIVVVSAIADREAKQLSGEAIEVIDWINKPIDRARLIGAMERCIEQSASSSLSILHVEDEADVRDIVSGVLGSQYRITSACSLEEATQLLASENFDLVIADLGLPDGSGLTLLQLLAERVPHIPVVLFSATEVDANTAQSVAAALVKSKTSSEILIDTIRTTIAGQPKLAREA